MLINIKKLLNNGEYIISNCDSCGEQGICYDLGMSFVCKKCIIKSNDKVINNGRKLL